MLLKQEREQVVEYCKKLITAGLTKGTGGNISIYNRETGLYAISPSGMDYFSMVPKDVVVMNLSGEVAEGERKPSSEWDLHRIYYENESGRTPCFKLSGGVRRKRRQMCRLCIFWDA